MWSRQRIIRLKLLSCSISGLFSLVTEDKAEQADYVTFEHSCNTNDSVHKSQRKEKLRLAKDMQIKYR